MEEVFYIAFEANDNIANTAEGLQADSAVFVVSILEALMSIVVLLVVYYFQSLDVVG